MPSGYYRHPTINGENVIFVCEDDLWSVPAVGGLARRLTSGLGEAFRPMLSPGGKQIAFVGQEEGQFEIYVMPSLGGPPRRLTHMGGSIVQTAGWTKDGEIIFANNAAQPFPALLYLYKIGLDQPSALQMNYGPARAISYGPRGGIVIGRNTADPARWKRYRGGTAGQIWIDVSGNGEFRPLLHLNANLAAPMWIDRRIYFVSDHEGIGNLYSCLPSGDDVQRHTDHEDFYARNPTTDGKRIVYHAGADIYVFDPATDRSQKINVEFRSPQTQRNRKFVETDKYLEDASLAPNGQALAITARGKLFSMANWEGAVFQLGEPDGIRYRLGEWLNDGARIVAVTDSGGEESFVILNADGSGEPDLLNGIDIGRPIEIVVNPAKDQIAFSNHRYEMMVLDLKTKELRILDRGNSERISGFAWSPDGEWLAYSVSTSLHVMVLKLWQAETGKSVVASSPLLRDVSPSFDPDGKYLYFVSHRVFDPVYDNMHFDLNFPRGTVPCLITLRRDLQSPFVPQPRTAELEKEDDKKEEPSKSQEKREDKKEKLVIDLDGIESRVVAFPVEEGLYGRVLGLHGGKVLYSRFPVEGSLGNTWTPKSEPPAKGSIQLYNFEEQKEDTLLSNISDLALSRDATIMIYRAGNRLRVLKGGEKPDREANHGTNRKSGWIDLDRIKISVVPGLEWRQMFRETWRLQRDQFWVADMSKINWLGVYESYLPLVDRVSSRSEFSDLLWEMQGELGTSHAYEAGGDYRPKPEYHQAFLGADFAYDEPSDSWKITHIVRGDAWDAKANSSLAAPGTGIQEGDLLLSIDGRRLSRQFSPEMALVNLAGEEVALAIQHDGESRPVTVKGTGSDIPARYREWVENNRDKVHRATQGQVGYVHIPDMGPRGYAEFHRAYLAEVDRNGLIVDLRFNGGGHVSPLILEKLARRRIGYDASRWGDTPAPFPPDSVMGPVVALTNEWAGSDGDIFSHGFKLLKLGPLLGKRTWGGVIGIAPRHVLVDGTVTTQPEFSFWFQDVGWGVENYGTDPDIEVENAPQDYARGIDAQLERAIQEAMQLLEKSPAHLPSLEGKPSRAVPKLPRKQ